MKPVFVDTSALIALGNVRDDFHRLAKIRFKELTVSKRHFITTNGVILELGNTFSSADFKPLALRLIDMISSSKQWQTKLIDRELMKKGIAEFRRMKDKDWGLVDCTSIVAAKELDIVEVMTNGHHFTQAGFTILLKNP